MKPIKTLTKMIVQISQYGIKNQTNTVSQNWRTETTILVNKYC